VLDTVFSLKYPSMYSFAKQAVISLKSVKETERLVDLFRIPMTRQAYNELLLLAEDILALSGGNTEGKDEWTFIWGKSGIFCQKVLSASFSCHSASGHYPMALES
jgi:hypothetical protein